MFEMKFLKLIQVGYESYNGPIGAYEFVNGVSTSVIPRQDRDRLATAFQFVEFTEEGVDEIEAGVAHRLVSESASLAENREPLARQTDSEKEVENAMVQISGEKPKPMRTFEELTAIADKKGIAGLREAAEPWGVKGRAIPVLISLILEAQNTWIAERQVSFERRGISETAFLATLGLEATAPVESADLVQVPEVALVVPAPAVVPDADADTDADDMGDDWDTSAPEPTASPSVEDAAATGDMSAAISGE